MQLRKRPFRSISTNRKRLSCVRVRGADFEANFIYILLGSNKALLIDTGAVADPKAMPLAKTILDLWPNENHKKLPLLVAHTHRHLDHRAGETRLA